MVCTGRDVAYRELEERYVWDLLSDSAENPEQLKELGLTFRSYRSNGQRLVEVRYPEPVTQVTQEIAP